MGFKGNLESFNLADIVQNLSTNQQSGTLKVHNRDKVKYIYFEKGEVRYLSRGEKHTVRLGDMLVGRGMANTEQVNAALAEQRVSGGLLGEKLIALNVCSQKDIDDLVRFQIEEEVYDLFSWASAEFEFTDGLPDADMFDPEQRATVVSINTSGLIMEAARRIDEWDRIRTIIPSMEEVFFPSGVELSDEADAVTVRVLSFLNGARDALAVVEDSHFSNYEVASALLEMVQMGAVRKASATELKNGALECKNDANPERAARMLEKALSLNPSDLEIRAGLSDALIELTQFDRAAIHLGVLGDEYLRGGDNDKAIEQFSKILGHNPSHIGALEKMARIFEAKSDAAKAVDYFSKLSKVLTEAGRLSDAIERAREGLTLSPDNTDLRGALAKMLISANEKELAIAEFEQLGETFIRNNQMRAAAEAFRRILQIDPRNKHAKNRMSFALSGKVAGNNTHTVRNMAIMIVILLLSVGIFVGLHEMEIANDIRITKEEQPGLVKENKYAEAISKWERIKKNWSVATDISKVAGEEIDALSAKKNEYEKQLSLDNVAEGERIEALALQAALLAKEHKATQAMELIDDIMKSRAITQALSEKMTQLKEQITVEEQEIDEFLKWKKNAENIDSISELDMLRTELNRTRQIAEKYSGNTRLAEVTRPLLIKTTPEGARVLINGNFVGPSPVVVRISLSDRPDIRLKLPGYIKERDRISISNSEVALDVPLIRSEEWSYDAATRVYGVAGGPSETVLVATQDATLVSVDIGDDDDGAVRLPKFDPFRTDEPLVGIISGILVRGDSIVVGTNKLYKLSLGNGISNSWPKAADVGGKINNVPSFGSVVIVSESEYLFGTSVNNDGVGLAWAVDAKGGEIRWSFKHPAGRSAARSTPLIDNDKVFVPFDDGNIYVLKAASGTELKVLSSQVMTKLTSPVKSGRTAWVGTADGRLLSFNLDNLDAGLKISSAGSAVLTDMAIFDRTLYYLSQGSKLLAFSIERRGVVWNFTDVIGNATGKPAVTNKRIYFGTDKGWLYAVDRKSGSLVWKRKFPQSLGGGVATDGKYLFVGSTSGYVYCFDESLIP